MLKTHLLQLYAPLVGWTLLGWFLEKMLPKSTATHLGKFLFWVGIPISIVAFLRGADLSGAIWIAPVVAWTAILLGAWLAWLWMTRLAGSSFRHRISAPPARGSFLLTSMVGNTGYIGYPVALALVGPQYFAWALFYDLAGTTLGAYGLGVALAAHFGKGNHDRWEVLRALIRNPALWSFGAGLIGRDVHLSNSLEQALQTVAWGVIAASLTLTGMRLSQLNSWRDLKPAGISLSIKMILVPLILGTGLSLLGMRGAPQLVMVLQMATPPAFATLVLSEVYNLDRELTVTTLVMGSVSLLITLPIWILLFNGSGNPI